MKKTRNLSMKINSLWTSIASGIKHKADKKDQNKESKDMGSACTPVSSLDLSGMNKEQAKAEIDKLINEKLEKVSMMEFSELDINVEKEKRMVSAEKRITERRKKRKQKKFEEKQLVLTEEGGFADFKQASIFDVIHPEIHPFDEEVSEEPIEGQISILDDIMAAEQSNEIDASAELVSSQEDINTSFDSAIDKVFDFCGSNAAKLVQACRNTRQLLYKRLVPQFKQIEEKLELKKKSIDIIGKKIYRRSFLVREFAENNKKKILVSFGTGVAVFAAITLTIGSMTAYEYIYNGKVLGIVKSQEDVYKIVDVIGDKLSYQYDAEIFIDKEKDIRFNKVIALNQEIDNKEDILNRLTYMRDMKANGYGIFVDGKLASILESEKAARNVLQKVKNTYTINDAGIEFKEVAFVENVKIKDVETKLGAIKKKDQAIEYLMTGAIEKKIHVVQQGETLSEISKMYGMKQNELLSSNPDVIPEKIQIGQEICLNQIVPLVTVKTVEVAQYKEIIPYEIVYENTSTLYKNEQTVKSTGSNGEKDVVAEILQHNGIEVSRKEVKTTILTESSPQVVLVGTKEPPPLIGTGNLTYPIRGTLTSRYGTRWGRMHSGIDLAAPTGTKIKASDGGKVIFAGY
ncbi:MAG: G5 domain-containing protein, partial [Eubacteriales bacterium]|nr:G5 domain-containing protein [Eubacteriales bacterium]